MKLLLGGALGVQLVSAILETQTSEQITIAKENHWTWLWSSVTGGAAVGRGTQCLKHHRVEL